jgi:hypothetical protein
MEIEAIRAKLFFKLISKKYEKNKKAVCSELIFKQTTFFN